MTCLYIYMDTAGNDKVLFRVKIFILIDTFGFVGYFSCMITLVEIRVNHHDPTS